MGSNRISQLRLPEPGFDPYTPHDFFKHIGLVLGVPLLPLAAHPVSFGRKRGQRPFIAGEMLKISGAATAINGL